MARMVAWSVKYDYYLSIFVSCISMMHPPRRIKALFCFVVSLLFGIPMYPNERFFFEVFHPFNFHEISVYKGLDFYSSTAKATHSSLCQQESRVVTVP